MSSIIPYNFNFPKANVQQNATYQQLDQGQAMVQAFVAALTPSKPTYNPPEIQLSKDAQKIRDMKNNLSPIPTFGVEDDRPQTDGELEAKLHPQFITEPLIEDEKQLLNNTEDVVGFNFKEIPINGMPNFRM